MLAADPQRSPPLETATPDADLFLDDGRMQDGGSEFGHNNDAALFLGVWGLIKSFAKIVLELVTHPKDKNGNSSHPPPPPKLWDAYMWYVIGRFKGNIGAV